MENNKIDFGAVLDALNRLNTLPATDIIRYAFKDLPKNEIDCLLYQYYDAGSLLSFYQMLDQKGKNMFHQFLDLFMRTGPERFKNIRTRTCENFRVSLADHEGHVVICDNNDKLLVDFTIGAPHMDIQQQKNYAAIFVQALNNTLGMGIHPLSIKDLAEQREKSRRPVKITQRDLTCIQLSDTLFIFRDDTGGEEQTVIDLNAYPLSTLEDILNEHNYTLQDSVETNDKKINVYKNFKDDGNQVIAECIYLSEYAVPSMVMS